MVSREVIQGKTRAATAVCIGNIDDDPDVDIWTVSSEPTVDWTGATVPPGTPARRVNDSVKQ